MVSCVTFVVVRGIADSCYSLFLRVYVKLMRSLGQHFVHVRLYGSASYGGGRVLPGRGVLQRVYGYGLRVVVALGGNVMRIYHIVAQGKLCADALAGIAFHHAANPAANAGLLAHFCLS